MNAAIKQTLLLFIGILMLVTGTFSIVVFKHKDSTERVQFSLYNQHGEQVTEKHFAGRHMLVFFGYTSCPDICPTQVVKLSEISRELEAVGDAHKLAPVFISVDPERDTEEKINAYLSYFHERIIGLTGPRPQLKQVTDTFGTLLQEPPEQGTENYLVAHSSLFYVVDAYGRIVDRLPLNLEVEEIVQRLQSIMG